MKSQTESIDGTARKTSYSYDDDNWITRVTNDNRGSRRNYSYNGFSMVSKQQSYHKGALTLTEHTPPPMSMTQPAS